jgi:hypothetical protein
MSSPVTNDSVKSLASNISKSLVDTSISLATAKSTNNPIDIVNAAIANTNNPISDIGMTELVTKIDTENKLKLYVTYEKDATGELSIKDQYYIDKSDVTGTVVKKVKVNS